MPGKYVFLMLFSLTVSGYAGPTGGANTAAPAITDRAQHHMIALAMAADGGSRAQARIERRLAIERLRRAQRLEALRRAERAALRRWVEYRAGRAIAERRKAATRALIRDRLGRWILRNHILSIAPDQATLARLGEHGFSVQRLRRFEVLDIDIAIIRVPAGIGAEEALNLARQLAPEGRFEANHLFDPSAQEGALRAPRPLDENALPWLGLPSVDGLKIGQIDLGVDQGHPALQEARIHARIFTGEDQPAPSAHGTAIASLLVGRHDGFAGASLGAELYAADVFGEAEDGGSVEAIVGALEWMAAMQIPVVAMPLAGPPNALLDIALNRATARGIMIVAPVGNDGPTKAVAWPAAHPDVVAVTATDDQGRVFLTAHRGPEVLLSAVGVALPAAADPDGLIAVEGTSFAVPEVAARLLRLYPSPNQSKASAALALIENTAQDLGDPGRDPVYGAGWVSYRALPMPEPQRTAKE
ncbi:MAG: hypothetical protein Tsb0016_20580 [Sphingomonadales bacterium]